MEACLGISSADLETNIPVIQFKMFKIKTFKIKMERHAS